MKRICPVCNSEFEGRIDKKFCCDQCRNTYNNKQYQDINNYSRNINRILKNNRRILFEIYQKKNFKITKEKMLNLGFNFDYLTNIYKTRQDKNYFFCYDYGYCLIEENLFQIVERKEYVD